MFYGGDNSVNNQKIYQYNAEGNNRFLPGLQPLTTESVEKEIFFQYGSIIVFSMPVIILLSSAKQNIQVMNILRVVMV
jgi:hypothetical protein